MAIKKESVRVGEVYETDTFAGVKVHSKIVSIDDIEKGYFSGQLVRREDVLELISKGVPYKKDTPPSECVGFIYDFQILRKVRKSRKHAKKQKNAMGSSALPKGSDAVESRPRRRRRRVRSVKNKSSS